MDFLQCPSSQSTDNHNIKGNDVYLNNIGVYLNASDNNRVSQNTINDNSLDVVCIDTLSESSVITRNIFENNGVFGLNISGSNNNITSNDFLDNQAATSQAQDNGIDNLFSNNYWDDHSTVDEDSNFISDLPYNISGASNSSDNMPTIYPNTEHQLFPPNILNPVGGEIVNSVIIIDWEAAIDNFNHGLFSIDQDATGDGSTTEDNTEDNLVPSNLSNLPVIGLLDVLVLAVIIRISTIYRK